MRSLVVVQGWGGSWPGQAGDGSAGNEQRIAPGVPGGAGAWEKDWTWHHAPAGVIPAPAEAGAPGAKRAQSCAAPKHDLATTAGPFARAFSCPALLSGFAAGAERLAAPREPPHRSAPRPRGWPEPRSQGQRARERVSPLPLCIHQLQTATGSCPKPPRRIAIAQAPA